MGFLDAIGGAIGDAGKFLGTEVFTPKNILTAGGAVGGSLIGQPHLGAAAGRSLGQATFGGDWDPGHSGEKGGIGRVLKAGAEGYGLSQGAGMVSGALGGPGGTQYLSGITGQGGAAGGAEAAGSGMIRDASTRGVGSAAGGGGTSYSAGLGGPGGLGTQASTDAVLGEVPNIASSASAGGVGGGGTSYLAGLGGAGGGGGGMGGLANTNLFGTGISYPEAMMGMQGISTLGNIYGQYERGRLEDEIRKRRRRVMSAFMPLMEQRMERLGV